METESAEALIKLFKPCLSPDDVRDSDFARGAGGRRGKPRLYGSLGFLRWPQQDFAGEGLQGLSHNHGHGVGYVRGLQHFLGIFS